MRDSGGTREPNGYEEIKALFVQHRRTVRGFLRRQGFDEEEINELVQETFLRAWKGWSGFRREAKPLTWLLGIAERVYLDYLRRQGRQKRSATVVSFEGSASEDGVVSQLSDASGHPEPLERALRQEEMEMVRQAMADLPRGMRIILKLSIDRGLKHREIATLLKVSEGTVKSQIFEAKVKIKKSLAPLVDES